MRLGDDHVTLAEDLLAPNAKTVAYTYIGSELTWPIYWEGTWARPRQIWTEPVARFSKSFKALAAMRVAVLKAIVSQASAAIPVVPLYAALLFRVMKEQGSHEECIEHIERLFTTQLSSELICDSTTVVFASMI